MHAVREASGSEAAQENVAAAPPARIYGQPLEALPADLYIPPDALAVLLEAFEGPLDLLLYLIRKANIDILDIPMAPLTRQYLDYIERMHSRNLELAAEYLVMAAMLIEIKSRMLLPRQKAADGEAEADDPRAELVRRLMEYEQIRRAAGELDRLPVAGREFLWVETWVEKTWVKTYPAVSLADLQDAWRNLLRQASLQVHHQIKRETLSVREHMTLILRRLQAAEGFLRFEALFDPAMGAPGLVVHFIALLELAREQLVHISQSEALAPIYVRHTGRATIGEDDGHA